MTRNRQQPQILPDAVILQAVLISAMFVQSVSQRWPALGGHHAYRFLHDLMGGGHGRHRERCHRYH